MLTFCARAYVLRALTFRACSFICVHACILRARLHFACALRVHARLSIQSLCADVTTVSIFTVFPQLFLQHFFCRDALSKAEKTTERLAKISKDVLKIFEMVNPKDSKKYAIQFYA